MSTLIAAVALVVAAAAVATALHYRGLCRGALRRLAAAHARHGIRAAELRAELLEADYAVARLVGQVARLQQHVDAVMTDAELPVIEDFDAQCWAEIVQHWGETADEPRRQP